MLFDPAGLLQWRLSTFTEHHNYVGGALNIQKSGPPHRYSDSIAQGEVYLNNIFG